MKLRTLSILLILLFSQSVLKSEIRLPKLISDGMVLQRNAEVKIWGWAYPGEQVTLVFLEQKHSTKTNASGNWEILLSNLEAGGGFQMKITGENTIVLKEIYIGDVWICSGQSNMETTMKRVSPLYSTEISNCENPNIRQFYVPRTFNFKKPQEDFSGGQWVGAHPESIAQFSAVAYFFALELYQKYQVPIGLINTALGGSPAEAWLSEEALKAFPEYYKEALRFKDDDLIKKIRQEDQSRMDNWYQKLEEKDAGYQETHWKTPDIETSDWATMNIPGYWADGPLGQMNGSVWFRKEVEVPKSMTGQKVKLLLGRIVDSDSVFINGTFVGNVTYQYPPRRYSIPAGVLKEGKNTIVIRVVNNIGRGGFFSDKPYLMESSTESIDLKGPWQYKPGVEMTPLEGQTFIRFKPLGLYNAMIAPFLNYRIKGVIWYQGESNVRAPVEYDQLFPALIRNWRQEWGQGDFPFLYVQLANFLKAEDAPMESNWARLREAQTKALSEPNTGMAVTIDIGEWNDIHPLNKKDVGKRLALAAQKYAFGEEKVVHSGPMYKSLKIKRKKIILTFDYVGSGLMSKNGNLKEFAIAGVDKKFVWAKAKIKGDKIIVSSKKVKQPVAVRYAWANNPQDANLYNEEGLPASPFRTDEW